MSMIDISVVIPTRNRANTLYSTLLSIENQTLDQVSFEIIICDNNSTDNTVEVCNSFSNKFINFKYVKTNEPGLHVGRNKGYQVASGEILVYADDDIEAFPEWLFTISSLFKDPSIMLVGGKNLPKWEVDPPDWAENLWKPNSDNERIISMFSIIDLGDDIKEINPFKVYGCNFSVRKDIIRQTKGFHPDGFPRSMIEYRGDGEGFVSEYILKNNYKAIYHPNASVYHLVSKNRLTFDYVKQRSFNQGVSTSYAYTRYSGSSIFLIRIKILVKSILFLFIRTYTRMVQKEELLSIKMKRKTFEGFREGFLFHQHKLKKDPKIEAWVLKGHYL